MADAERKLRYVGRLVPGSMHDFTLLKKDFPPDKQWFNNLTVRLDSGFQGFNKSYPCAKLFLP
ncbi:hypothetical protein ACFP2F_18865, partial [Hymenobacter artigasi]|uniref:hypothetical protein n=1 Tax=Hymenobacter artigasi TaxID=2719616 RepID=UPI00360B133C